MAWRIMITPPSGGSVWDYKPLRYPRGRFRHLQTLWWRAPEVALGSEVFDGKVDVWSLACVLVNMAGESMFSAQSEPELLKQIENVFGTTGNNTLFDDADWHSRTSERLWAHFSGLAATAGNEICARLGEDGMNLLTAMFRPDPHGRLTSAGVVEHNYCNRNCMHLIQSGQAGRGSFSIRAGQLETRVLHWLRGDKFWSSPNFLSEANFSHAQPPKKKQCMENREAPFKKEFCYFFDATKKNIKTSFLSCDVAEQFPSCRLLAWGEAFKNSNTTWLQQLGVLLRASLSDLTDDEIGKNGEFLIETDPRTWLNQFAILQIMTADTREDPLHYDGGASLIHMGITLYGQRRMELKKNNDDLRDTVNLCPGNVYIGNLCAVEHQIFHEEKHGRAEQLLTANDGVPLKVAIMLRTSLFAYCRARKMSAMPTPRIVYDRANAVVAKHLRDSKLVLPSYQECLAAMKLMGKLG